MLPIPILLMFLLLGPKQCFSEWCCYGKMKFLLYPFSLIYSLIVSIRNKLFDWGILREQTFDVPIIAVGNLAVGGTGKTPHTEWLISLLKDKYKVAVLSRGYKRQTKGFVLADENSTAKSIGDEPFQIKSKFPDIAVAVDKNRRRGIENVLGFKNLTRLKEVILLDDAFQHRYVKADLSILLTDYNRLYTRDYVLPAGRLREPKCAAKRADIVIVTKCPPNVDFQQIEKELCLKKWQKLYFSTFRYEEIKPVFQPPKSPSYFDCAQQPRGTLADANVKNSTAFNKPHGKSPLEGGFRGAVLLLTGIVSPKPLYEHLTQYTNKIISMNFPDHHDFSQKDIENISKTFAEIEGEKIIITTEKDAARLVGNPYLSEEMKKFIYSIGIEVEILQNKENELNNKILELCLKKLNKQPIS